VVVTCDNAGTVDGDNSDISGVTIGGVAATKAAERSNTRGSAQGGVTASIWYLQLSGALGAGSTITATFTTATTSGDQNTIQAREFTVASGKTVSVEATAAADTDAAPQPASLDCTTTNIECLRVCAHSIEEGATDDDAYNLVRASNNTWSLWWTSGKLHRSTGVSASNVSSIVEAKISTGTTAPSQIGTYATGDWVSVYAAFKATATAATAAPPGHPIGIGIVAPNAERSSLSPIFESQITG
jgi:hypothetical protein